MHYNHTCEACSSEEIEEVVIGNLYHCLDCGLYFDDESYLDEELELKVERLRKRNLDALD